jgi:hypothetical protein
MYLTSEHKLRFTVKIWVKLIQANGVPKRAVVLFIHDKADFKSKSVRRNKETLINGTIKQEVIKIITI